MVCLVVVSTSLLTTSRLLNDAVSLMLYVIDDDISVIFVTVRLGYCYGKQICLSLILIEMLSKIEIYLF